MGKGEKIDTTLLIDQPKMLMENYAHSLNPTIAVQLTKKSSQTCTSQPVGQVEDFALAPVRATFSMGIN